MRIAVLSDIHANHLALQAVLIDSSQRGVEKYWFLGDLIGYGPNPVEAVQWLMGTFEDYPAPDAWVMGNHDAMLADLLMQGKTGATDELLRDLFNYPLHPDLTLPEDLETLADGFQPADFVIQEKDREGKETGRELYRGKSRGEFLTPLDWKDLGGAAPLIAIELNRLALDKNADVDAFWRDAFIPDRILPNEVHLDGVDYVLVHSGQVNHLFRYIYAWQHDFLLPPEFKYLQEQASECGFPRVQLYGHTHVPTLVKARPGQKEDGFDFDDIYILPGEAYPLPADTETPWLALVNPGSVGQPRDLDQRAAYAILDTTERTVTFHRAAYEYQETARLLSLNYYPRSLRERLLSAAPTGGTPDHWKRHYQQAREIMHQPAPRPARIKTLPTGAGGYFMSYFGVDPADPFQSRRRNIFRHAGFRLGAVGGLLMWGIHLILLLIFQGTNQGDFLAWTIQLFVYFFMGRTAAQKHYDAQRDEVDALRGVQGAGTGAALVTSILVWVFIILRSIVRDAVGFMVLVDPIGLFCVMVVDVLIALGLGSWGGKTVVRKHQTFVEHY